MQNTNAKCKCKLQIANCKLQMQNAKCKMQKQNANAKCQLKEVPLLSPCPPTRTMYNAHNAKSNMLSVKPFMSTDLLILK